MYFKNKSRQNKNLPLFSVYGDQIIVLRQSNL